MSRPIEHPSVRRSTLGRALRTGLLLIVLANVGAALGSLTLATFDERANPATGQFVTVQGRRLHFVRSDPTARHGTACDAADATAPGTCPATLVLLHGGGTSLLDMQLSLLPRLHERLGAKGHTIIAFDRPGHGYSDALAGDESPRRQARLIGGALTELGLPEALWVGHSRAAAVVLAALLEDEPEEHGSPAALGGVLIAGVAAPPNTPPPAHVALLQRGIPGTWFAWTAIEYAGRQVMPTVVANAFAPEAVPPDYIERTALALSLRPAAARHDARERAAVDAWLADAMPRYERIPVPVHAVHGTRDAVVPLQQHLPVLRDRLPSVQVTTLPGAGHGLLHTRTEKIVAAIEAMLEDGARGGT